MRRKDRLLRILPAAAGRVPLGPFFDRGSGIFAAAIAVGVGAYVSYAGTYGVDYSRRTFCPRSRPQAPRPSPNFSAPSSGVDGQLAYERLESGLRVRLRAEPR